MIYLNKGMTKSNAENIWVDEYHNNVRYGMKGKILVKAKSAYQEITIIQSYEYGMALLLDGCWMTAEKQEKYYHECLVHPALCSALEIKNVLVIGGGDGGTIRQCLMHNEVESLDMVEIDSLVVELSKKYLKDISGKSWSDPRLNLQIRDGVSWVKEASDKTYDVILVDGSDPQGPAEGLFNKSFFQNCKRILKPGGIFATQSESPVAFPKIHIETVKLLRDVFPFADPMYGWVPMYPSGFWSWTFASESKPYYLEPIKRRAKEIYKECDIWSEDFQKAGFKMMPRFIAQEIKDE